MSCPLCFSSKAETIFSEARLANITRTYTAKESRKIFVSKTNTDLCVNCGFLYRNPIPTVEQRKHYYRAEYYETYKALISNQTEEYSSGYRRRKKAYEWRYFSFFKKNKLDFHSKRILDIGCGTGYFLATVKDIYPDCDCIGIEPSEQLCKKIANTKEFHFVVLNGTINDFSSEQLGVIDIVTMIGVIEHLSDPLDGLKKCREFMSPTSCLYIFTHNESPSVFIDLKKRISLVHQLYFTPRTMKMMLKKAGLDVIDLECRNTEMHVLAKKSEPDDLNIFMNKKSYMFLKSKYLVNKAMPSLFFSFTSKIGEGIKTIRIKKELESSD